MMEKVEFFYFDSESETSGEKMFDAFAAKHEHLFDEGCSAVDSENKLE